MKVEMIISETIMIMKTTTTYAMSTRSSREKPFLRIPPSYNLGELNESEKSELFVIGLTGRCEDTDFSTRSECTPISQLWQEDQVNAKGRALIH